MKISVIIPTYNRVDLLRNALQSLLTARLPKNLEVFAIIVDNNSTDDTKDVFENYKKDFSKSGIHLTYEFEERQGKSFAVNRGITESKTDLVSILDDDMQVAPDWFEQIEKVFRERWETIDFIAGKVLPIWEGEPPEKIIPAMKSAIAIGDHGNQEWEFGEETPILSGGHAVLKKQVFDEVGLYPLELGPSGKNLIGCEDDIFYNKILKAQKRGIYYPPLEFYHFVPQYRLSKSYFRQWCFGVGRSWNLMDAHYQIFKEVKLFSVPRYMYRELIVSLGKKIKAMLISDEEQALEAEKGILIFSGFFYAKNIKDTKLERPLKRIVRLNTNVINR